MVKGEVIVVFYEKLQPIQEALDEFAAQPVVALPPVRKPAPRIARTQRLVPTTSQYVL